MQTKHLDLTGHAHWITENADMGDCFQPGCLFHHSHASWISGWSSRSHIDHELNYLFCTCKYWPVESFHLNVKSKRSKCPEHINIVELLLRTLQFSLSITTHIIEHTPTKNLPTPAYARVPIMFTSLWNCWPPSIWMQGTGLYRNLLFLKPDDYTVWWQATTWEFTYIPLLSIGLKSWHPGATESLTATTA